WNPVARDPLPDLGPQLVTPLHLDPPDLVLHERAELVESQLLDDVLHACPAAVGALAMAVLHAHDRLAPHPHVLGGDEARDVLARKWRRAEAAAGPQREAALAVPDLRIEADVVDRDLGAILSTSLDGDLELPRQREVERIEEEVVVDRHAVRRDVEG